MKDIGTTFKELESFEEGLDEREAQKRLLKYGFNQLEEKVKVTPLKVFLRQFVNFIVWVLLAAALISLSIGESLSFWVIIFIIAFVILMGFFQEYKAERAMEALKSIVQPTTTVLRNNRPMGILTKNVVLGDVLLLETGDKIPADAQVFDITGLKVDEATLTGESTAVQKKKGDRLFAGTQIVHGKCRAVVVATGMDTKLGQIAGLIQEEEEKTPLQVKIANLAKTLAIIALVASLSTFILGIFSGAPIPEMLIIALALAVSAVPEGLPLTMTITLAYGMRHMAKHNAIIRKMLAVETLGSTTVICTDKTGTLTKNEMTVQKIYVNGNIIDVTGVGYEPKGNLLVRNEKIDPEKDSTLTMLLKASALCNNAVLEEREGKWNTLGDPTEVALVVAAAKADLWKDDLKDEYKEIEEIIFTSERKMMSTVHSREGENFVFSKGAPEVLLERCGYIEKGGEVFELGEEEASRILAENSSLASSAFRVLGVAYKKISEPLTPENIEKDLIFLGLTAMIDPARKEVFKAVKTCHEAGIKVFMITGDNEDTAKAIGKQIGIFNENKNFDDVEDEKLRSIIEDGVVNGRELSQMRDEDLDLLVDRINIYARSMPEQKLRIVKSLQKKRHVVAMTGDGVNDAPALKRADIGISMGIKGTDVAKESSVMVLQDDNFATIVEAVKRGRTIYENIEKFTAYLISRNFTEIILILLGVMLLGFEFLPLLALQILFINMFDELMPAIALGLDPIREEIMYKKPREPGERILKKRNLMLILSMALIMGFASFLVFVLNSPAEDIQRARTLTFATIVSMILFIPFAFRSLERSIFSIEFTSNRLMLIGVLSTFILTLSVMYIPFLAGIFELTSLELADWVIPVSVAFMTLIFAEGIKVAIRNVR